MNSFHGGVKNQIDRLDIQVCVLREEEEEVKANLGTWSGPGNSIIS